MSSGPRILGCLCDCNYCNDVKDLDGLSIVLFFIVLMFFQNFVKLFLN